MSIPPRQHLSQPYAAGAGVQIPVTQPFGALNSMEPLCWDYQDGTYGFAWQPGATEAPTHLGIDYGLACGAPLLAAAAGTVHSAGPDPYGFGNLTILDHGSGLLTFYAHQAEIQVHSGQQVNAGAQIGLCGTTGNSTGCHLHFACAASDGRGYYLFFDPAPFFAYQPPVPHLAGQAPTAGRYKLLVDMMLRTQPAKDAPTGELVKKDTVVVADQGWTTNFRRVKTPDGHVGWLFAGNLAAA